MKIYVWSVAFPVYADRLAEMARMVSWSFGRAAELSLIPKE